MRLLSIFLWSAFILNWVLHLVNNLDALRHWTPSLYVLIFLLYTSWWVCLTTIWFVDYFMHLNSWNNRGRLYIKKLILIVWLITTIAWVKPLMTIVLNNSNTSIIPLVLGAIMISFGNFHYLYFHRNARIWTICKLVLWAFLPLILWSPIAMISSMSTSWGLSEYYSVSTTIHLSSLIISSEILLSIIVWYVFNTIEKSK